LTALIYISEKVNDRSTYLST